MIEIDVTEDIVLDNDEIRSRELVDKLNKLQSVLDEVVIHVNTLRNDAIILDVAHPDISSLLISLSIELSGVKLRMIVKLLQEIEKSAPTPDFIKFKRKTQYHRIWNEKSARALARESWSLAIEKQAEARIRAASSRKKPKKRGVLMQKS
ncbi:hypothetical protein [Methylobacterium isbiliense]|uniref:hypothetical protein n=1 Tax=Methylobacterium isbiliense TaxID=315478 RepID=UPI001EE38DA9|nr:hypothetical protein [Methylobacterium isbiliense]MDN3627555.1 hypothetical protein [Methylobacterium isbiliense]